nr:hypothetical protein [Acidobacteriota bacterium]
MTIAAMVWNLRGYDRAPNYMLLVVGGALLALAFWLARGSDPAGPADAVCSP